MTKVNIFKTLINILRDEQLRTDMEFRPINASKTVQSALADTGLIFKGMGMYSVVVVHYAYPNRVFKVSTSRWDGFRVYAKYCMERQGTPLIPTIYSANEKGNFAWYEMDMYHPCTERDLTHGGIVKYRTDKIGDTVNVLKAAAESFGDPDYQLKNNTHTYGMRKAKREEYLQGIKDNLQIAKRIYNAFKETHRLDVHRGNLMVNDDGEVIITDPFANDLRTEIPVLEADPTDEEIVC